MTEFDPSLLYRIVDLAGVFANGFIGGAVARRLRFDVVGFVVLAVISGLGGGILRDTLIQAQTPIAFTDPWYLSTAIAAAVVAFVVELRSKWPNRFLTVLDAAAIGCWSATGTIKALSFGMDWLPAVFLGCITAVGGGMVRDICVGQIPQVFGGNTLYATGAFICSLEMLVCFQLGVLNLGLAISIVTSILLVLAARRLGWALPGPGNITAVRVRRRRRSRRRRANTPQDGPNPTE